MVGEDGATKEGVEGIKINAWEAGIAPWRWVYSKSRKDWDNLDIACSWMTINFKGMEFEIGGWGVSVLAICVDRAWSF